MLPNPHTEANLIERRAPVGRKLGLVIVKPSLSSWKVELGLAAPELGVVMKGWLTKKQNSIWQKNKINRKSIITSAHC